MKAWVFASKEDPGGWIEQGPAGLPDLPVLVRVTHSGVNYKDALSLTRRAPIARSFPMAAGIDLVGTVIEDRNGAFSPGEPVVATGHGLGETTWGGYAEQARVRPEWLTRLPAGLSQEQAAAVGTAGLTAAMAIDALERFGVAADQGPVVVTGPTGGVGSFASLLLKHAGYHVVAATGRPLESEYLKANGAAEVIERVGLESEPRSLGKERWRAGVDVIGGKVLANLLSSTRYGGAIAACGLAGSMALPTSVAPFILRGVSLLGVDSVMAPDRTRRAAWDRIAAAAAAIPFDRITTRRRFSEVAELAPKLLDEQLRGRVVLSW
jgi:acrylyl-CoA reductase (NADPH)